MRSFSAIDRHMLAARRCPLILSLQAGLLLSGSALAQTVLNQQSLGTTTQTQQLDMSAVSSGVTASAGGGQINDNSLNQIGSAGAFFTVGSSIPVVINQAVGDSFGAAASFSQTSGNAISANSSSLFGAAAGAGVQGALNQSNALFLNLGAGGVLSLSQTAAPTSTSSSTASNSLTAASVGGTATVSGGYSGGQGAQQATSSSNSATLNIGGGQGGLVMLNQSGGSSSGTSVSSTNTVSASATVGSALIGTGVVPVASPSMTWLAAFLGGGLQVQASGSITAAGGLTGLGTVPGNGTLVSTGTAPGAQSSGWLSSFLSGGLQPLAAASPATPANINSVTIRSSTGSMNVVIGGTGTSLR